MKQTILIIEDNEDIRDNTEELLSLAGYDVISAVNGLAGLEKAQESQVDLILCDIMMPELDGYGVLRAINNIPELKGTPFVYLTAKSEKSDFRNGMDLGADDYLTKPFTGDELLRVVEARLKKRRERMLAEKTGASSSDLTDELTFEELSELSPSRSIKTFRAKSVIYMEGDTATDLAYVISGKVKTTKTNEHGKEYITEMINPGGFFGHLAILGDGVHKQSAVAMENSEIAFIPRHKFLEMLTSNHSLAIRFLRKLSKNVNESEEKLVQLAYNSARKRVAEGILFIYRQYKKEEDTKFSFPVFRENLSAIAGISPESVSRNLSDFKDEKLIVTENGNVRIIDFKRLTNLRG